MVNRGTRTVDEVAKGIGVGPSMLHRWHQLYGQAVAADRRAETSQGTDDAEALRRRVRQLEQENALLKKAAAFFAKENL